ncbi:transcriptional regulator CysB-like protein [Thermoplasmatales archaeon]|nr:transcriptional regulator CysB-like protein [Thermoplasmatales archaeon]
MTLDMEQIRTFCDVCLSRNFTKTASKLGITESTVSYRIKEMEKFFERKLFNRREDKSVECTEFGNAFFAEAQEILSIVDKYKNVGIDGELIGTIKVSAGEIGGVFLLPPIVRAFESKFTKIRVKIEINNSLKTLKKLSEGECDLGVTASVDFEPNPYLKNVLIHKLLRLTYGIITPAGHPLSNSDSLNVSKLIGLPYISRDDSSGSQREILKIFEENRIRESDLNVVWRFDNSSSVINAVAEGLGLSIVSRVQASKYVQGGLIRFIPIDTRVESYVNLLDIWKGTNKLVNVFVNFAKYYVEASKLMF